jgi:hypothetical protein
VQPYDEDEQFFYQVLQVMEQKWNEIDRENRQLGEKPVPVPLCPHKPHKD